MADLGVHVHLFREPSGSYSASQGGTTAVVNGTDSRRHNRFFEILTNAQSVVVAHQSNLQGDSGVVFGGRFHPYDLSGYRWHFGKWASGAHEYATDYDNGGAFSAIISDDFTFPQIFSTLVAAPGLTTLLAQSRPDGLYRIATPTTDDDDLTDPDLIQPTLSDVTFGTNPDDPTSYHHYGLIGASFIVTGPTDAGTNCVGLICLDEVPVSGSVTIECDGDSIVVPYSAFGSAGALEAQVELLIPVGVGKVNVTGGTLAFPLDFHADRGPVPAFTFPANSLLCNTGIVFEKITTPGDGGTAQVSELYIPPGTTGGTYRITDGSNTTATLAWDANSTDVASAITIGLGKICSVSGTGAFDDPYVIEYTDLGAQDPLVDTEDDDLTGPVNIFYSLMRVGEEAEESSSRHGSPLRSHIFNSRRLRRVA